ncbi:hypothetical protein D2E98_25615 [Mycobacteroides abscessus]|nr:hypothetical protein DDJ47_16340 [Mycobacteroides abscessus]RIT33786.1 hypothetical protein D2E98_25615 [Mycobacteroides abscessus]
MGQMLIRRKPHLYWTLATGSKRSLEYQKAVIAGFRNVPNKKYVVEYGSIVAILGMRVVKDELRDDSRSILLNVLLDDVEGA